MPRRSCKQPQITAARVEQGLDQIAELMVYDPLRAHLLVPLYKRLEREIEKLRDDEAVIAAARRRLTRSPDRTAA